MITASIRLSQETPFPRVDPAGLLRDLQGQVVALRGDDLIGRHVPARFERRPDAFDLAFEPRLQLAEHPVAEEAVGFDHLDRREPPVGHQGKIRRKEPGHLVDPGTRRPATTTGGSA